MNRAGQGVGGPPPGHELLLHAALLEREPALAAWAAWKARTDVAALDLGSRRLLAQLYRNLHGHGLDDPVMETLREIYSRTRTTNERMLDRIAPMLRALAAEGIATLVLKGAALTALHYRYLGARPMDDVDILVPLEQVRDAIGLLERGGWRHHHALRPEAHIPYRHAANFRDASGWQIDLHWHVMIECCQADADATFWAAARDTEIAGIPTKALCSADQLLHVCVHGQSWLHRPSLIRWIADAFMIMKSEPATLDWNRLIAVAEARRLGYTVHCAVAYLTEHFDAPVPSPALARLRSIRTFPFERLEHRTRTRARTDRLLGGLPTLWFLFRRLPKGRGLGKAMAFVDFLRYSWGLQRMRQVPSWVIRKALRRTRRMAAVWVARLRGGRRPAQQVAADSAKYPT